LKAPLLAQRMRGIAPFRVMDILARAKGLEAAGHDVVHMEVGEPDFPAPAPVIAAAQAALQSGKTHYTPAGGIGALREALATYYSEHFNVSVSPKRIVITPGASGALQLVLGVLINHGDRVWVQDPGYPCNRHMIEMYGGIATPLPVMPDGVDSEQVLGVVDEASRALMFASPANPTGEVIRADQLAEIYRGLDLDRQVMIVDEIYQGLEYGHSPETALKLGEDGLFVINSFSKFFGMTGFRVGWVVAPSAYVEALERLAQNLFLAPPTVAQYGALAVFDDAVMVELERRRRVYEQRRDGLFQGLKSLGFALPDAPPPGAFYLYAGLNGLADSGEAFANALLEKQRVAVTPGVDFGVQGTRDHVRFAYTTSGEQIEKGLERIENYLRIAD